MAEAREYMDGYFAAFPGVRHYMDEVVRKARETGYVETLLHRRQVAQTCPVRSSRVRRRSSREGS